MAIKLKSNVGYQPIVTSVSRKFVPKKETCKAGGEAGPVEFESSGWMGGAVRNTARGGLGACTKNYLVVRSAGRQTQPSADELDNREMFATAVKGRNYILKDLSQMSLVQIMWIGGTAGSGAQAKTYEGAYNNPQITINGVSAYGYTYKGWIMAVQFAGLKNAAEQGETYNANQFPTDYDA